MSQESALYTGFTGSKVGFNDKKLLKDNKLLHSHESTEITVNEQASYGTGHVFLVIFCLMMLITISANYILFSIAGFHTTSPKFKLQNY